MLGLNPRVINQLARQQAELSKNSPDGKLPFSRRCHYFNKLANSFFSSVGVSNSITVGPSEIDLRNRKNNLIVSAKFILEDAIYPKFGPA